jgi:hypothetical protein
MPLEQLTKYLTDHGVTVPPELGVLQAVADYRETPDVAAKKMYAHQIKMDEAMIEDFVQKFLRPGYDKNFAYQKKEFVKGLGQGGINTDGGKLEAADKLAQHLNQFQIMADGLRNGKFRDVNEAKQWFAKKTGKAAPQAFDAVAQAVGFELSRVLGGTAPTVTEMDEIRKNIDKASSPEQLEGVIDGYIRLAGGAYGAITNRIAQYYRKGDAPGARPSKETARLFGERGFYVPQYGQLGTLPDGRKVFSKDGGKTGTPIWW